MAKSLRPPGRRGRRADESAVRAGKGSSWRARQKPERDEYHDTRLSVLQQVEQRGEEPFEALRIPRFGGRHSVGGDAGGNADGCRATALTLFEIREKSEISVDRASRARINRRDFSISWEHRNDKSTAACIIKSRDVKRSGFFFFFLFKLSEMTADYAEEHSTSTLAAERIDAETSERLRLERELQDMTEANKNLQQTTERLEMELLYARAADLNGVASDGEEGEDGGVYRQRYEHAVRELEFTKRKMAQQHEDDLEQLVGLKKQLEKKVRRTSGCSSLPNEIPVD